MFVYQGLVHFACPFAFVKEEMKNDYLKNTKVTTSN